MVNVLVVEDEKVERETLARMICEAGRNIKVWGAESKYSALDISRKTPIDFFYIDIALKNSSGMDLALELRCMERYKLSWIIFVTSNVNYMLDAFKKTHCYDYVIKPYDKDKVIEMTKLLIAGSYEKSVGKKVDKHVSFSISADISVRIKVEDIVFIAVNLRLMTIYTRDRNYKIRKMSLKKVLDMVDCRDIIQTHRAYAVNINFISSIQKISNKSWEISFGCCGEKAFLSYNFKDEVMKKVGIYA
ncbi:MAG: LytTR family DNA-binding domain-containing protein [Clostridium sp.]|jgi:two-component system LytT family response regulator|uniref:LytR/AlgR family response regulator transcription factor n=1 Tax=Clostridium sp. TaxID=1506 RepID=UPI0025B8F1AC|nr:LytTR family DNA-binding domain-containing protein [Clostridium sp.]MCH3963667.1 LytTR family DNA-binding domain-containing protein [Clostridium sp.]MCI1714808.1 LytTR family DNA-binding domain-containing protein [Clostridium sp.]MCI1799003.1 LytTR family DNA-binding domain-containing protein [Clostridium sp.]MCI1812991.1 LytTR family DNA-binding domain-containing protein [Clostridium sp.]MCI1869881.1 LytTR family DNA-binding domain-containing protein [Clostridium sp.]